MPITVTVAPGSPANATFHRVRLLVTLGGSQFEFSSAVSGTAVRFDIASAFRAVYDSETFTATPGIYSAYTAQLGVCDDYMTDGELHPGTPGTGDGTVTAYPGSLTDMERLLGTAPARYSRKPTSSPEVCFVGYQHLAPVSLVSGITPSAPAVNSITVAAGATVPAGSPAGSKGIYGIPAPADGYELRFINSLDVHENVFVTGLPATETTIQTERYVISRQETVAQFSRGISIKQNDHERYLLSTGPLDAQWQRWYVHEVLMARWAWIGIGGHYIPCHLLPDDTVKMRDRQKAAPITVQFTAELDINGSPFA